MENPEIGSCGLCGGGRLRFAAPPIYCIPCGALIKKNAIYYCYNTTKNGVPPHYLCAHCYNSPASIVVIPASESGGGSFVIPKPSLDMKVNDEPEGIHEESWVQCGKCQGWQHQICGLFNAKRRNDGGDDEPSEYTCPNCSMQEEEVETGEGKPSKQKAVPGAKELARTILSDHIERRLSTRLNHERQERASAQGKNINEVPGAEGLIVRVVSSVDRQLEVSPWYLEMLQDRNYPPEFQYKSKVLLLFQEIEGVDVCLFGMCVQEFGSECLPPNHRRVCISIMDSVKYFRPDVKTVTGEALRTFVYHEILIGYLEHCKNRGFGSCYMWASPPLDGEDYVFYRHPKTQKTPNSNKLRDWCLSMFRKAAKEDIVVDITNLYDHFFVSTGECKVKVTATRVPYFDGDYWPGAAEDVLFSLPQEQDDDVVSSTNRVLMDKVGETICPMKGDFIMVHLEHCCTRCCILMVTGTRWVCHECKNFQLCDSCYEAEQKLGERKRHPIDENQKHILCPFDINDVPVNTKDRDEIMESEFFDTRQEFMSLCQGNHYQYDTLRRAKHSSLMILYHLHNPTAPAFGNTCNRCYLDIKAGQGWRCETCPEYDLCNACYQKDGGSGHPHELKKNHPPVEENDAQSAEARQMRVVQLRKMLELLVHGSSCRAAQCQYPKCQEVKRLFRHGIHCEIRANGGCVLCKRMWYLLQLHAQACKEFDCHVPRCRDLRAYQRRMKLRFASRRRAAVIEMMKRREAEAGGMDAEGV